MNTIKFTLHLAVEVNGKLVSIHELPAMAEYTPNGEGFDLDFSLLYDDTDEPEIDINSARITNALEDAYKMAGFSRYIDRLIWKDIEAEKEAMIVDEGRYPSIIDDSRRYAVGGR